MIYYEYMADYRDMSTLHNWEYTSPYLSQKMERYSGGTCYGYGMELDTHYVDVIRKSYENFINNRIKTAK